MYDGIGEGQSGEYSYISIMNSMESSIAMYRWHKAALALGSKVALRCTRVKAYAWHKSR